MKHLMRYLVLSLIVSGMILSAAGCAKAGPDDAETQALAKQFMTDIFVNHDSASAFSLVVPITTYGYVTQKIVEDTVGSEVKKSCSTPAESVQVGRPGGDVDIAEVSEADSSKGITARTAWTVSSTFTCAGQGKPADRVSVVYLEKVNGKWGISKVDWATGLGQQSPAG
jgi:hypothetical protein